jgi:hypothetical protein
VRNNAGSVLNHSGYACQQQLQINEYRRMWSQTPGTTDPLMPFGVTQVISIMILPIILPT